MISCSHCRLVCFVTRMVFIIPAPSVIPAKAGIQENRMQISPFLMNFLIEIVSKLFSSLFFAWIPAFAGMTGMVSSA